MRSTCLLTEHQKLNALLGPFAGWQMPIHYGSAIAEHQAVRQHAGIFDVSHMGLLEIKGQAAADFCRYLLANDIAKCQDGQALYSCLLNESAGVIDDLIAYRLSANEFRWVVNAGSLTQVMAWLQQQQSGFAVEIQQRECAILAVQGPNARQLLAPLMPNAELSDAVAALAPFTTTVCGEWQVARTGYTGEDGVELMVPLTAAPSLWQSAMQAGIEPCGLAARDSLRLEAGYCLYGHEMDVDTSPWVAALGWTSAMQPQERRFIGRQSLQAQREAGMTERLCGLVLRGGGVLRDGMTVLTPAAGHGMITSGGYSPTLGCSIALARVPASVQIGDELTVERRGRIVTVRVVKPPFVKQGKSQVD
jgi:aminomethyltransferase